MMRMKSQKKTSKKWQDHYTRKAKNDQFPARSVFKLKEIQRKYNLIQKGYSVLDLGCSPGSWLLYAAELVGKTGQVTGIDKTEVAIQLPGQVKVIAGDIFDILKANPLSDSIGCRFNVVLSDMAPSTTGNKIVDSARSYELSQAALYLSRERLLTGGSLVCKIFQGEDFQSFVLDVKGCFQKQKIFKPKSSRKTSKEIYVIGMGKK